MCKLRQKNLQKRKEKAYEEERPRVPKTLGVFLAHEEPKKDLALCIQSLVAMRWIKGVASREKDDVDDPFRLSSA